MELSNIFRVIKRFKGSEFYVEQFLVSDTCLNDVQASRQMVEICCISEDFVNMTFG